MMKIVAPNVVASRPPERRLTATVTARANSYQLFMKRCSLGLDNHGSCGGDAYSS